MYQSKSVRIGDLFTLLNETKILLTEELDIVFKLDLTELAEQLIALLKPVEDIRNELLTKYQIREEMQTGKTPEECSLFANFEQEMEKVLSEEREIKYIPIKRESLNFKSKNNYPLIYKLRETAENNI